MRWDEMRCDAMRWHEISYECSQLCELLSRKMRWDGLMLGCTEMHRCHICLYHVPHLVSASG